MNKAQLKAKERRRKVRQALVALYPERWMAEAMHPEAFNIGRRNNRRKREHEADRFLENMRYLIWPDNQEGW